MNKATKPIVVTSAVLCAGFASASMPWSIDWAHTAMYQHFLFKMEYIDTQYGHKQTISLPRAQLNYGVTKNFEVNAKMDLLDKRATGSDYQGLSDATFGAKWRFYQDKRDTEMGLGYN